MINVTFLSATTTSITFNIYGHTTADDKIINYQWGHQRSYLDPETDTFIADGSVDCSPYAITIDEDVTITGLIEDTSYRIRGGILLESLFDSDSGQEFEDIIASTISSNTDPDVPRYISPNNDTYTVGDDVQFSAYLTDPDGDLVSMTVRIYKGNNFYDSNTTSLVTSGSYASWTRSGLPVGDYWFEVKAEDIYGNDSSYSDMQQFTIQEANVGPDKPLEEDIAPADGSTYEAGDDILFVAQLFDDNNDDVRMQVYLYDGNGGFIDSYYSGYVASGGYASLNMTSLVPGDYQFRIRAQDRDGLYSSLSDSRSFTITGYRPATWSWSTTFSAGNATSKLTAAEWNNFCDHINVMRDYKGWPAISFYNAVAGEKIYDYMFNQVVNAIDDMDPPTSVPGTVSSGGKFYASYLDQLANAINSID